MTTEQKTNIAELRQKGYSYSKISEILNIPKSTIKTYCFRNKIELSKNTAISIKEESVCKECGKLILQTEKIKTKKFCSKKCREKWWHLHPEKINQKAIYSFKCAKCGITFTAYGNKHRKYCSHKCYIAARFKEGDNYV